MSRLPSGQKTQAMTYILQLHEGSSSPEGTRLTLNTILTGTSDEVKNILNTQTHSGSTALMYIFKKPVSFSLFGKSYKCPSFISTNGNTMNEDLRNLVSALLYKGADPEITDDSGKTVFDYAGSCGEGIENDLRSLVKQVTMSRQSMGASRLGNATYNSALTNARARGPPTLPNTRGLRSALIPEYRTFQTPSGPPTMANIFKAAGQRGASRRKKSKKYRKTLRLRQRGGLPQYGRSTVAGVLPPINAEKNKINAIVDSILGTPTEGALIQLLNTYNTQYGDLMKLERIQKVINGKFEKFDKLKHNSNY